MIRILQVVSSLNINAGMMSVIMNYYRNIDRTKIQFDFLYFAEMQKTHQNEIEELGGRCFFMPHRTLRQSDQKKIQQFFEEHKGEYVAVHCHPVWASTLIAKKAKKSGIKHIIQHSHSTEYSDKKISALRNKILMKFIRCFATDFMACNEEAANLFRKKVVEAKGVYVLRNAIDLTKYLFNDDGRDNIRKEFGISEKTLVVGSVGRFCIQKNPIFIVEIFDRIRKICPDSKLILVGDGEKRAEVEKKILELNLGENVIMTGKRRDVQAILSSFDLFLMPSIFEGTPVAAIEALTNGLPCVLSDTITKSIDMNGAKYVALSATPDEWAKSCVEIAQQRQNYNRHDYSDLVRHGFDIKEEAMKLQNYYLNLD